MIDEDFRTFVVGVPGLSGVPVEKGKISEEQASTRVYYQRAEQATDLFLSGAAAETDTSFDVEVASLSDATAQTLADAIKAALNGFPHNGYSSSAFGSTVPLGVFVADHSDDYQPKGLDADEGYFVAAFRVQVIQ